MGSEGSASRVPGQTGRGAPLICPAISIAPALQQLAEGGAAALPTAAAASSALPRGQPVFSMAMWSVWEQLPAEQRTPEAARLTLDAIAERFAVCKPGVSVLCDLRAPRRGLPQRLSWAYSGQGPGAAEGAQRCQDMRAQCGGQEALVQVPTLPDRPTLRVPLSQSCRPGPSTALKLIFKLSLGSWQHSVQGLTATVLSAAGYSVVHDPAAVEPSTEPRTVQLVCEHLGAPAPHVAFFMPGAKAVGNRHIVIAYVVPPRGDPRLHLLPDSWPGLDRMPCVVIKDGGHAHAQVPWVPPPDGGGPTAGRQAPQAPQPSAPVQVQPQAVAPVPQPPQPAQPPDPLRPPDLRLPQDVAPPPPPRPQPLAQDVASPPQPQPAQEQLGALAQAAVGQGIAAVAAQQAMAAEGLQLVAAAQVQAHGAQVQSAVAVPYQGHVQLQPTAAGQPGGLPTVAVALWPSPGPLLPAGEVPMEVEVLGGDAGHHLHKRHASSSQPAAAPATRARRGGPTAPPPAPLDHHPANGAADMDMEVMASPQAQGGAPIATEATQLQGAAPAPGPAPPEGFAGLYNNLLQRLVDLDYPRPIALAAIQQASAAEPTAWARAKGTADDGVTAPPCLVKACEHEAMRLRRGSEVSGPPATHRGAVQQHRHHGRLGRPPDGAVAQPAGDAATPKPTFLAAAKALTKQALSKLRASPPVAPAVAAGTQPQRSAGGAVQQVLAVLNPAKQASKTKTRRAAAAAATLPPSSPTAPAGPARAHQPLPRAAQRSGAGH
jgi:hypothetical protein